MKESQADIERQVREYLFSQRDEEYRRFCLPLMPTVDGSRVIGVRVPLIRKYARTMTPEHAAEFMSCRHFYHEEKYLHGALICLMRDPDEIIRALDDFLPCVDNWAVCDGTRPRALAKHTDALYPKVLEWLCSDQPYTVRFAIGMLCSFYLGEEFCSEHLALVGGVRSDEYYVNMMSGWYFAEAASRVGERAIRYIEEGEMPNEVRKIALRKVRESNKIAKETKIRLSRVL